MQSKEQKDFFKHRLYRLVLETIKTVEKLPRDRVSQIIADQLIRSITSVCANYIEAYAASSKRDFANYFRYSLKSANESKFWIALLRDTERLDKNQATKLLNELDEVSKILGSSLITLKGRRKDL